MAVAELIAFDEESLLLPEPGYLTDDPDCCCGGAFCGFLNCDCNEGSIVDCQSLETYYWRIGDGDFNCTNGCGTAVQDGVVAAGGGKTGAGIDLAQNPTGNCCAFVSNTSVGTCSCETETITPGSGGAMTINCEEDGGECFPTATVTLPNGGVYRKKRFNLEPTALEPERLDKISDGPCCNSPDYIFISGEQFS